MIEKSSMYIGGNAREAIAPVDKTSVSAAASIEPPSDAVFNGERFEWYRYNTGHLRLWPSFNDMPWREMSPQDRSAAIRRIAGVA